MEKSMAMKGTQLGGNQYHSFSLSSSSSIRDVCYSCGSCGYELNLSSSNRNTSAIGSKYGKSIKRGIISFLNIDESRFNQVDEFHCFPLLSRLGLFRRKTKLLCRKCGNHIGNAYVDKVSSLPVIVDGSDSSSSTEVPTCHRYDVKIRALQPTAAQGFATPLFG